VACHLPRESTAIRRHGCQAADHRGSHGRLADKGSEPCLRTIAELQVVCLCDQWVSWLPQVRSVDARLPGMAVGRRADGVCDRASRTEDGG
jgi:hypothetical protein